MNWNKENKAVVIDRDNAKEVKGAIGMPSVIRVGDRLAMLYDGAPGENFGHMGRGICLAWLKLPLVPRQNDNIIIVMSNEKETNPAAGLKEYPYAEAVEGAKEYFGGDDLAATVWVSKYAPKRRRSEKFTKNRLEQTHWRIANEIARVEGTLPTRWIASEVYHLLGEDFKHAIPQGGPMTGIGNNLQIASLSNCFVIGHRYPADTRTAVSSASTKSRCS